MNRTLIPLILLALPAETASLPEANGKLFQAVRDNQLSAVKPLLAAGADINARDASEATPLMYASGVGSLEMLTALLEAGADVNLVSKTGTSALMWGILEPAKVRMLLGRGAAVNIANSAGVTPLTAALTGGADLEVVRALLAKGVDAKAGDALLIAYRTRNPQIIEALAAAGAELKKKGDLGATPFSNLGPAAPIEHLRALLDLGTDPNELGRTLTLTIPALGMFANSGRADAVRLLLERGANPDLQGNRGYSALMLAAAAVRRNPEMVRILLEGGATINLTDEKGRTALDWALTQGETELASLLRKAGGKAMTRPSRPTPVEEPRTPVAGLAKVIPLLAEAGPVSARKVACVNCHNNSLAALALRAAREHGSVIPDQVANHYVQTYPKTMGFFWETAFWSNRFGTGYVEWALAELDYPRSVQTDVLVGRSLRTQREDGRWGNDGDSIRPPLSANAIKTTAFNIRVLDKWAPPVMRAEAQKAIAHGRAYLKAASASDTQDLVFQLLGLRWAGATTEEIEPVSGRLLALQREDGGWGQLPTMPTDAYATGQALYALRTGTRTPPSAAYQRGVAYLLRNQLVDGSWFVPTRAFGFQPYYEGGFPHGVHQFISASASAWAAMAISYTLPN
jgi:ankyrin repeat protein